MSTPRKFEARYPGRCGACPDGIDVGDTLTYDEDDIVIHVECRAAPDPIRKPREVCPRCFTEQSVSGACACD